jgi:hypothetical protein
MSSTKIVLESPFIRRLWKFEFMKKRRWQKIGVSSVSSHETGINLTPFSILNKTKKLYKNYKCHQYQILYSRSTHRQEDHLWDTKIYQRTGNLKCLENTGKIAFNSIFLARQRWKLLRFRFFWHVTSCNLVDRYQLLEGICCFHLQDMEAIFFSETLVPIYQGNWRYM